MATRCTITLRQNGRFRRNRIDLYRHWDGYPETGQPVEVFYADGQRIGSQLQHAIQDACVLISLLLQYGVEPNAIAKTLSSAPVLGDPQPATVIGVIAEAIKEGVVTT